MRYKLTIAIPHPDDFVKYEASRQHTFSTWPTGLELPAGWFRVKDVEVEVEVNDGGLLAASLAGVDKRIAKTRLEFTQRMEELESERASLLAITHES